MKKLFTASVWQEDNWFIAHCNEVEIASQGKDIGDALNNLREALELHFEEPTATVFPSLYSLEAEVYAAV
jgi:predicted RNase H-like HicB family nuclease